MRAWLTALLIGLLPGVAAAQAPSVPAGTGAPPSAGVVAPPPSGRLVAPSASALVRTPNDFPHPTQTWNFLGPSVYPRPESVRALGQVLAYFEIPAQHIIVPVAVSIAETLPLEWRDEVVIIPGYYVTETTTGYIYPERWVLEQLNVGVYGWRLLPAEFRRK